MTRYCSVTKRKLRSKAHYTDPYLFHVFSDSDYTRLSNDLDQIKIDKFDDELYNFAKLLVQYEKLLKSNLRR